MNGWLVVNDFLVTEKFNELFEMLINSAREKGINLIKRTNLELMCELFEYDYDASRLTDKPDFVLFWDKDVKLAKILEEGGLRLFNNSEAILDCDDKSRTFLKLRAKGIRMPKTFISPLKYIADGCVSLKHVQALERELTYPMVVKKCFGSFGEQVYLPETREELIYCIASIIGKEPYIVQEFVKTSFGRDIRIEVVGGKAVAAMYRYNDDFRANISHGGKMKKYDPTPEQTEMAEKVCKILNLDFAGVDILFGENDEPVLCEVNSNAHIKNLFECTGKDVSKDICEHIMRNLH